VRELSFKELHGVTGGFGGLASIIGLIAGGILYDFIGGMAFMVNAIIIFIVFIMSFHLLKMKD
jgi:hypothetical protein